MAQCKSFQLQEEMGFLCAPQIPVNNGPYTKILQTPGKEIIYFMSHLRYKTKRSVDMKTEKRGTGR